jgi:CysZ protein
VVAGSPRRPGFLGGARCLVEGFELILRPGIRAFVVLPLLLSAAVLVPALWVTLDAAAVAGAWVEAQVPSWLAWLGDAAGVLLGLLLVLLGLWLFVVLATILGGPLLGLLSARVERQVLGREPEDPRPLWVAVPRAALREVRKLAYHLARLALVFALTLVPVVAPVSPALWLLFGAWMMAVQFVDLPLDNRGRPFPEALALLRANVASALGFGSAAVLVLSVPLLQLVAVPAAAAGATLWFLRVGGAEGEGTPPASP